jgi:hypothetical protein
VPTIKARVSAPPCGSTLQPCVHAMAQKLGVVPATEQRPALDLWLPLFLLFLGDIPERKDFLNACCGKHGLRCTAHLTATDGGDPRKQVWQWARVLTVPIFFCCARRASCLL